MRRTLVGAAMAGVACGSLTAGVDSSDPDVPDASTDAGGDADARPAFDAGPCSVVANDEDVRGRLAPTGSALYWTNGAKNSIRKFDGTSVSDLFVNADPDGGVVTAVAVAGDAVVWSADRGGPSGGVLHVDSLAAGLGKGPTAVGLVPQSFDLASGDVLGVADDRTQDAGALFAYRNATPGTFESLRSVARPFGDSTKTDDGWVWVESNGVLRGAGPGYASVGSRVAPAIASDGSHVYFVVDKSLEREEDGGGVAVAANVDAFALAIDSDAAYFFAAPPSPLYRLVLSSKEMTPITTVGPGGNRLAVDATYVYWIEGTRILRCEKHP
jgi:hypothetical protein